MKKRIVCGLLLAAIAVSLMVVQASAAEATLNTDKKSAWSAEIVTNQATLDVAWNSDISKHDVYFDFKYYDGGGWKKDKCAVQLQPNRRIQSAIDSTEKPYTMSWIIQLNTWNCWYSGCYAYGNIS